MCGIVGYVGKNDAISIMLEGLNCLEYRGYDSAGVAVISEGEMIVRKYKGRLDILRKDLTDRPIHSHIGIGHNRWATHGEPSDANAHPHQSWDGLISVVHNGIIENYAAVKAELQKKGIVFSSDTDTEVIAQLIRDRYKGDILKAVASAVDDLAGAYSIAVLCRSEPGRIIALRRESPLIIGLGEGENFIVSDAAAIATHTRSVIHLEERIIASVQQGSVELYNPDLTPAAQKVDKIPDEWTQEAVSKSGYEHFMLKEIFEQPHSIRSASIGRIAPGSMLASFDSFAISKEQFLSYDKIYIAACGTAYYAGMFGKYLIEKYARRAVDVEIASEFRYKDPIITKNSLFIGISQSGETNDTLACLKVAKKAGATTLAVTNVLGSQIDRESDFSIYTMAGPEIAVASTKAYSTQIVVMYILALIFGQHSGNLSEESFAALRDGCLGAPGYVESALSLAGEIREAASWLSKAKDIFFIGRGADYSIAMEGALKMKEISYIHAEAHPSGELKHGPIALIEEGTPVVAVSTREALYEKTLSNIKELKARGAKILLVTKNSGTIAASSADSVLYIGEMHDDCAILPTAAVLQLLAYDTAVNLGRDVDRPRNLAKSVTVE
ncbi:MAG: glutamine--fructose-6-phosphate transaminase (isomerizing) [Eubacteriaceae bacterium]|nr:glutamine--fructose-6-phosphate transaminase (isomerizing) [Eubacteriaceae bacterium]